MSVRWERLGRPEGSRPLKPLLSTGEYGEILPRLAGLLFLGLGIIVVQIIRLEVTFLYPTTLALRAVFFVGFVCLYIMSRDPLFLVLLAVLGVGMLATSISYVMTNGTVLTDPDSDR